MWYRRISHAENYGRHHRTRRVRDHGAGVTSVAFSADGNRIVCASYDNTVKIWDADTGAEIRTLWGHTSSVSSVAYSADGDRIVSGSFDGTVKVWELPTGK